MSLLRHVECFPRESEVATGENFDRTPFLLKLDATILVPLDFSNVNQSLDTIVGKGPSGPPGKLFLELTDALKLLDAVRTGPSAIASINDSATEHEKAHFARFRSRLKQGDLFTAMGDSAFLAFCSTEHPQAQRLNLPPLASRPDSVFVTRLVLENRRAYVEVAETAEMYGDLPHL
ncbi:hypothetical protein C8R44DRAFT_293631 [Mycena epipterygia]|nr:hypothetical protein C8R44DRAFT_293631 [Mycena epipterygia]